MRLASVHVAQLERPLGAVEGLLERDFDGLLGVGALPRGAADARAPSGGAPEELFEQAAQCNVGPRLRHEA